MLKAFRTALWVTLCCVGHTALGEDKQPPAEAAKAETMEAAFARKMTCEFVDTPIKEVLSFLQSLKVFNVIASQGAQNLPTPISLKVVDMPTGDVLKWVCKLANLKMEIDERVVYISVPNEEAEAAKIGSDPIPVGSKMGIKLANGNEFEGDAALFNGKPELLDKLVERFLQDHKAAKK